MTPTQPEYKDVERLLKELDDPNSEASKLFEKLREKWDKETKPLRDAIAQSEGRMVDGAARTPSPEERIAAAYEDMKQAFLHRKAGDSPFSTAKFFIQAVRAAEADARQQEARQWAALIESFRGKGRTGSCCFSHWQDHLSRQWVFSRDCGEVANEAPRRLTMTPTQPERKPSPEENRRVSEICVALFGHRYMDDEEWGNEKRLQVRDFIRAAEADARQPLEQRIAELEAYIAKRNGERPRVETAIAQRDAALKAVSTARQAAQDAARVTPEQRAAKASNECPGHDLCNECTVCINCAAAAIRQAEADARQAAQEEMRERAAKECRKNADRWKEYCIHDASCGDYEKAVKSQHRQKACEECETDILCLDLTISPPPSSPEEERT